MTDKEKAEKYLVDIVRPQRIEPTVLNCNREIKKAYIAGLTEGRKENAELKKENAELYEVNKKLQWKVAENINLKAKIEEVEKEIERLKARCAEIYFDS